MLQVLTHHVEVQLSSGKGPVLVAHVMALMVRGNLEKRSYGLAHDSLSRVFFPFRPTVRFCFRAISRVL